MLLSHKSLFFEMTWLRLKVRYKQSLLGWIWAVLPVPATDDHLHANFFQDHRAREQQPALRAVYFSGLIPWTFFSTSVSAATAGIVTHRYLISRVVFPREIIPLSYVAAALVDLGIGMLMLVALMCYFGFSLTLHAFYAALVIGMLVIFSVAVALLLVVPSTLPRYRGCDAPVAASPDVHHACGLFGCRCAPKLQGTLFPEPAGDFD